MPTNTPPSDTSRAAQFWDDHYRSRSTDERPGSNPTLVDIVTPLAAGSALDLGCGRGGDALWLAERGWRVTAVDVSHVVLADVDAHAASSGLDGRTMSERHDLAHTFPNGRFDLVSAQYLHTPLDTPRAEILRSAANALTPGGRLVVVDHGSIAPWSWNQDPDTHFATANDVAAELRLDPTEWEIERADQVTRRANGPNGQSADVIDHVLVIRRNNSPHQYPSAMNATTDQHSTRAGTGRNTA